VIGFGCVSLVVTVFRRSEKPEHESDVQSCGDVAGHSTDDEVKVHRRSTTSQRLKSAVEDL